MGNRRNDYLIALNRVEERVGKALHHAASRPLTDECPSFWEEANPLDRCIHFLEETEAQPRQFVVIVAHGLIEFSACW